MNIYDIALLKQTIKEEDSKLLQENMERLKFLKVNLRNPVLPQHTIESCAGSHSLTPEEIRRFQKIVTIKKGYFTSSEDKVIIDNWKAFCKLHKWDTKNIKPFLVLRKNSKTFIRSKAERRKFVQFLADGLPHRTLYSVYHRFRNIFEERVQTRFSAEEDRLILEHLEHNVKLNESRKYADLALVLKRSRAAIWRRYKLLKKKHQLNKFL